MSSGGVQQSLAESSAVADIPDRIVLARHLELQGRGFKRPVRYVVLVLLAAFLVLGLLNVFGLDDVQWAVMETSGAISFSKKPDA